MQNVALNRHRLLSLVGSASCLFASCTQNAGAQSSPVVHEIADNNAISVGRSIPAEAQVDAQSSSTAATPPQALRPLVFDVGIKFGGLGRSSTFNLGGAGTSGGSSLVGLSTGVTQASSPRWSKGLRLAVLLPLNAATGLYPSKLLVVGTFEGVVAAKVNPSNSSRPVTVYGAFGGAAGSERFASGEFLPDTETVFGITAAAGAEIPVRPHIVLFAEAEYMYLPETFNSLRVNMPYSLHETVISGAMGLRFLFR